MAKNKTIFECNNCGAQFSKWNGRCLECGGWGTLKESNFENSGVKVKTVSVSPSKVIDFSEYQAEIKNRLVTNISEADRVFGGGILPGSVTLMAGEPGVGKSTLIAQIACAFSDRFTVLYSSGEESAVQVKSRFDRLGLGTDKVKFISENNADKIVATINEIKPSLVIIDSIQTSYTNEAGSEPGSVGQIRTCAAKLLEVAKQDDVAVILIGHVTKDGAAAGPKALEHIVDTVLYLESDNMHGYRILRSVKNRFGSVNEIGIFEMTGSGFTEIKDPSNVFLEVNEKEAPGSVISMITEGTRTYLVEIQALVTKTAFGYPLRKSSGFDLNRLQVLTAVLSKRAGLNLSIQDVIVNIAGGIRSNDPSLDLAVCLAIASSLLNQTISRDTIAIGEVSLNGEIRKFNRAEERIKKAEELGFKKAILPDIKLKAGKIKLYPAGDLQIAIKLLTEI